LVCALIAITISLTEQVGTVVTYVTCIQEIPRSSHSLCIG